MSASTESRRIFAVSGAKKGIAAAAAAQYIVVKEVRGGRTSTKLTDSAGSEREQELARMLAGAEITAEARAAAERLIRAAG